MRKISTIILLLFFCGSKAQVANSIYRQAFNEQLEMLNGINQIDFKRAVFITENAYHNGELNYESYCNEIAITGKKLNAFIKQRGLQQYKTAGNFAVFNYMIDTTTLNDYKPCTYDFDDFMGDKDWTKMFVTKLMKTRSGNCHSLPYYYKILSSEIGASAYLALAPNHCYIKHQDEKGQWTNIELTNGSFPRDQWIIESMSISVEAIKNEAYMTPLTDKENIALCMLDLLQGFRYKYGSDRFVLEICDTALTYYPKCIPLLMEKANFYKNIIETEMKKTTPNIQLANANIVLYKQVVNKIDALGYKDMPAELYQDWVKSVEAEKSKRGIVSTK